MAYKRISPQPVIEGGTGQITLTNHTVLVGAGTSGITQITAGTTGQVLTGVTGSDPVFAAPAASSITITGDSGGGLTGNSFTFTGGSTGLTFAGSVSTETLGGTLVVSNGGTGVTSNTAYAVLCGGTTSTGAIQSIASVGSSGQVLTSNGAGALPTFQAAAAGSLVLLKTLTASSSSSLTFTSTYITSTYKTYFIKWTNWITSAGGVLNMDISADNGSTYKTDNDSGLMHNDWNSATWTNVNSTTTNPLTDGTNGTLYLSGQMWIHGLASAAGGSTGPVWTGQCFRPYSNILFYGCNTNGYNINNLKFSMASGTITSGTISLYGVAE